MPLPSRIDAAAWRAIGAHPTLLRVVAVTAIQASAQFVLFSYLVVAYREALAASPYGNELLLEFAKTPELIARFGEITLPVQVMQGSGDLLIPSQALREVVAGVSSTGLLVTVDLRSEPTAVKTVGAVLRQ